MIMHTKCIAVLSTPEALLTPLPTLLPSLHGAPDSAIFRLPRAAWMTTSAQNIRVDTSVRVDTVSLQPLRGRWGFLPRRPRLSWRWGVCTSSKIQAPLRAPVGCLTVSDWDFYDHGKVQNLRLRASSTGLWTRSKTIFGLTRGVCQSVTQFIDPSMLSDLVTTGRRFRTGADHWMINRMTRRLSLLYP
jgi:hypothetical protein